MGSLDRLVMDCVANESCEDGMVGVVRVETVSCVDVTEERNLVSRRPVDPSEGRGGRDGRSLRFCRLPGDVGGVV